MLVKSLIEWVLRNERKFLNEKKVDRLLKEHFWNDYFFYTFKKKNLEKFHKWEKRENCRE